MHESEAQPGQAAGQGVEIVKAFTAHCLVKAIDQSPDGRWLVHAPPALMDEPDYDEEIFPADVIKGGLAVHRRLGGHVDYAHMYVKTKEPRYLIGKSVDFPQPAGEKPIFVAELFQSKDLARQVWEHLDADGVMGFSMQGLCKSVDPGNSKRVTGIDIFLMTIDPMPRGWEGTRIQRGLPPTSGPSSFGEVAKAMSDQLLAGDLRGWVPVAREKAITAGSGAVTPGDTGGMALRRESLQGGVSRESSRGADGDQVRCAVCGKKNRRWRQSCRECGCGLTHHADGRK